MHTTLLKMLSFIKEKAQSNYEEAGHLAPILFLNTNDGIGIGGIVGNDFVDTKECVAAHLRKLIAENNLHEYIFLSEAWAVTCQDMSEVNKWLDAHGTLEGFPGYQEIISLNYASPSQEIICSVLIKKGKVILPWNDLPQTPADQQKAQMSGSARLSGLWAEHAVQTN